MNTPMNIPGKAIVIAIGLSLLCAALIFNRAAHAAGLECDASVIDVVPVGSTEDADTPQADAYFILKKPVEVTGQSVFKVFRLGEANDCPDGLYPLMLYVGRLQIIDIHEEILIGRMIEFAPIAQYPRVRYPDVMVGDCLRLEPPPPPMAAAIEIAPEELSAEMLDISGLSLSRAAEPQRRVIPATVLFEFDSAVVGNAWGENLAQLAEYIAREKPTSVIVEGHTCMIGTEEYNLKLSRERASAYVQYLVVRHGLDRDIFEVRAFGESLPEDSNETSGGREKNRRASASVLFKVVPTTVSSASPSARGPVVEPKELIAEDAPIPPISRNYAKPEPPSRPANSPRPPVSPRPPKQAVAAPPPGMDESAAEFFKDAGDTWVNHPPSAFEGDD